MDQVQQKSCDKCKRSFPSKDLDQHRQRCQEEQKNVQNQQQYPTYASRHRCMMVEKKSQGYSKSKGGSRQAYQEFSEFNMIGTVYRPQVQNNISVNQNQNNQNSNNNVVKPQSQQLIKQDQGNLQKGKIADPNLVQQLPTMTYQKRQNEEQPQCQVCIQEFKEGEQTKFLQCLHKFHTICIDE